MLLSNFPAGFFWEADKDQGQNENDEEQDQEGSSAETKNDDKQEPAPVPYQRFKEVIDQLNELKQWRAEQEKAAKAAEKEAEQAEADRLAQQQKFEELAEKRSKKIGELETRIESLTGERTALSERAERAEQALGDYLATLTEGLPAHILSLLEKLDVVEQLEYITANHQELKVRPGGPPETPKPGERRTFDEGQRQQAQEQTARFYKRRF